MNRARVAIGRVALLAIASVLALAACTDLSSTPTAPRGSGTAIATQTSTLAPPASFGPPPSPTPDDTTPIVLDPALLAVLPASIDGTAVKEDSDEAADALNDPALPRIATGVDGAVAFDGGGNLVYAWVVHLRPDVFTDADFRQWRDAYDEGACAGSGGILGRAEAQIGGRTAYVTSCAAGLHTYHVWLKEQDILISASSIGDGRFGEKLLGDLRLPSPSPS